MAFSLCDDSASILFSLDEDCANGLILLHSQPVPPPPPFLKVASILSSRGPEFEKKVYVLRIRPIRYEVPPGGALRPSAGPPYGSSGGPYPHPGIGYPRWPPADIHRPNELMTRAPMRRSFE